MTKRETIIECIKGRESGHAQLYRDCAPYVYTLVKRYIKDVNFRKDLMQDVFVKVFLNIQSYDDQKGDFKHWIRKVAVNECLQHCRKSRLLFVSEGLDESTQALDENGLDDSITVEEIESLISAMPEGYRIVFMLSVMDGYNHDEIGEQLNISASTSRSQLTRAKKWLIRHLKNEIKSEKYGLF